MKTVCGKERRKGVQQTREESVWLDMWERMCVSAPGGAGRGLAMKIRKGFAACLSTAVSFQNSPFCDKDALPALR